MAETYFKLIRSVPTRAFQPLVLKTVQDRAALQEEIEKMRKKSLLIPSGRQVYSRHTNKPR